LLAGETTRLVMMMIKMMINETPGGRRDKLQLQLHASV